MLYVMFANCTSNYSQYYFFLIQCAVKSRPSERVYKAQFST